MTTRKPQLVFLVDDNETYLDTLEHNLQLDFRSGIKLEKYTSAEACLKNIHRDPDVVILDYHLPKVNGINVLRRIKVTKSGTEVVMLSANEKLDIAEDCIRNGAYDSVVKNERAFVRTGNLMNNLL